MSSKTANRQERTDAANEAERKQQILREIRPRGFFLDSGKPCLCGADQIQTRKKRGYSDFVMYFHCCVECGNEFTTYIEG